MDLTTVAAVQSYTGTSGNDQILALLVSAASSAALRYLDRDLFETVYSQTYPGTGTSRLILAQGPVTAVSSVQINGVDIALSTDAYQYGYVFDSLGLWARGFNWPQQPNIVTVGYTAGYPALAVTDDPATIPATAPYVLSPNNLYWQSDTGVTYFSSGTPLTKVSVAPGVGEYFVSSTGVYTFNVADKGVQVVLAYNALGIPAAISQAVNEMVGLAFKRRTNLDVRSKTIDAQTQTYIVTSMPPSATSVLDNYKRTFPG